MFMACFFRKWVHLIPTSSKLGISASPFPFPLRHKNHQKFQVPGNGVTESYKIYKAILGVGFPLHKPYIRLI